jgi:hypothetical protein
MKERTPLLLAGIIQEIEEVEADFGRDVFVPMQMADFQLASGAFMGWIRLAAIP